MNLYNVQIKIINILNNKQSEKISTDDYTIVVYAMRMEFYQQNDDSCYIFNDPTVRLFSFLKFHERIYINYWNTRAIFNFLS